MTIYNTHSLPRKFIELGGWIQHEVIKEHFRPHGGKERVHTIAGEVWGGAADGPLRAKRGSSDHI